jgi:hypothetical protein
VRYVGNWREIADADFAVPGGPHFDGADLDGADLDGADLDGADLDGLAAELAKALADPDPAVRDGPAYAVLATWLERGVLDAQLASLGDTMMARFRDPRVQARTFAPLVLAWVVKRGGFDIRWVEAFEHWYTAEADVRGYDDALGWLHAVAHGADLLGVLGRHRQVAPEQMLVLAAGRMLADTEYVWRDQEDDRLSYAIALTLGRPELTVAQSTRWLDLIDERFATGEPGPVPAYASNTMRTLRMLYLLADRGVRTAPGCAAEPLAHRDEVKERLARTLSAVAWFAG